MVVRPYHFPDNTTNGEVAKLTIWNLVLVDDDMGDGGVSMLYFEYMCVCSLSLHVF